MNGFCLDLNQEKNREIHDKLWEKWEQSYPEDPTGRVYMEEYEKRKEQSPVIISYEETETTTREVTTPPIERSHKKYQLRLNIDSEIAARFADRCKMNREHQSKIVESLMLEYLK